MFSHPVCATASASAHPPHERHRVSFAVLAAVPGSAACRSVAGRVNCVFLPGDCSGLHLATAPETFSAAPPESESETPSWKQSDWECLPEREM